ncbi:MAG: tRNA pseudouridine(38-40) synthase TruA [Chloroflexi bacterium]|nr:tRNA pseudouridine(38-40) synthase TruA [Chloroflexota bacterium]
MRRLALLLEYDGSGFHGFQVQANARTVQGALEQALHRLTGEMHRVAGAGRTDAGVHALGQVAACTTRAPHSPATFVAALNYYLDNDVAVRAACEVPLEFDPRRDATSRWYRYLIVSRPEPSPLARGRYLWVREALDLPAMQQAAGMLVGQRDLASFSGPLSGPRTTVRSVIRAEVEHKGDIIWFDMEASAFLPQQVRRTVGVLLAVGRGQAPPARMAQLVERPLLGAADVAAPAQGLYLMAVTYPPGMVTFSQQQEASAEQPLTAIMTGNRGAE